jgi:sortase A
VEEQRRLALSSFWLRTWVDYALQHVERLLVLALVGFFCFWLINGYGRDWLHQLRATTPNSGATSSATTAEGSSTAHPSQPPAAALPISAPDAERHRPAVAILPFETYGDAAASLPVAREESATADHTTRPDYLDPQAVLAPPPRIDGRPQRLIMPTLDVDTPVQEVFIQDGVWQVADYAAGYHHNTALPGETGNTVISGHAGLRGAVFRDLGALQPGDDLLVEAGGWSYRYRVRESRSVWPAQVEVMDPTPTAVLTLITCTAWDTQRLVVVADLIDSHPL